MVPGFGFWVLGLRVYRFRVSNPVTPSHLAELREALWKGFGPPETLGPEPETLGPRDPKLRTGHLNLRKPYRA